MYCISCGLKTQNGLNFTFSCVRFYTRVHCTVVLQTRNVFCSFVLSNITESLFDSSSLQNQLTEAVTFWLFASVCAVSVIFTIAFIPETKGKTLEQIEADFRGTSAP